LVAVSRSIDKRHSEWNAVALQVENLESEMSGNVMRSRIFKGEVQWGKCLGEKKGICSGRVDGVI
jgi:hypothetical protein